MFSGGSGEGQDSVQPQFPGETMNNTITGNRGISGGPHVEKMCSLCGGSGLAS
jgi:hypothetical protein